MKTLYIECNMGVAGDMLMGALYELCDQKEKFLSDMNQAFAPYGVTLSVEPAVKCGISGTHMRVAVHGEEEHSHDVLPEHIHEDGHMTIHAQEESPTHDHCTQCLDCQHFFRQIFLGYFSDIVQAFDTLRKNVCGDDYTSLHNPIVLSSVLPAYGMFHSIQILFL